MKILKAENFYSNLNNTHLLLDTSVFIDAFLHPAEFGRLFNELKEQSVTLVTIDPVKIEFLKGIQDTKKFEEKKAFIDQIIDICLPISSEVIKNLYSLVKDYQDSGKILSITDLLIGATLKHYPGSLYLLTKNPRDFPTTIFKFTTHMTLLHQKALQSYGVYVFDKAKR
ncbi:MAG TPA: PIN domain-containing protein [Candidatus Levybacteria bacterium]|nr:PIN domain-containing protein [Candidatus Levybacteria bacterium]